MPPPTDVAIIGVACRFPGAPGPAAFWELLRDGREAAGATVDAAAFDADFFNVSPREAQAMDPRQRLALELAWEAVEDAFVLPEKLRGQQVSVFLGAMGDDYAMLTLRDVADHLDHHSFTGLSRGMIANRISYALGWRGPSLTVDSGQSSSLVAVHLACESVRTGQSPLAVAGGVHLNLAAESALLEREFGAVSPSGHTYAFDRRADGYARGEGGGLVLLKPLDAALRDGDRVRGVIRGGAVGNAGHHPAGQTVPSAAHQADVLRRALAAAGLDGADVDYVEAHGTGTAVGDAVEAEALRQVFAGRPAPLLLGSVKTNIGHAGGAAGIAGLLKTVLALQHSVVPPTLNHASSTSVLDRKALRVPTDATPWPERGRPRRAGVSSFGMGGTNAHVIVEQAPAVPQDAAPQGDPMVAWVVSGRTDAALAAQAERLAARLGADEDVSAVDVGWSLATTRTVFEQRAVLVGAGRAPLVNGLAALASGNRGAPAALGRATALGKTVFVFPGQGTQRLGMGRELWRRFPVFAQAFDAAVAALDGHLRRPLREVMWGDDPTALRDTEFAQPALFAVEVALAALWRSWGVVADVVLGHSVGEIAAACVAGVLSLPDAARVVAARGRSMGALPAGGVMVAVGAAESEVAPLLGAGVSVAAVNGPRAVVVSGERDAVEGVVRRLAAEGVRVRPLAVSHAFHSAMMEPMLAPFAEQIGGLTAATPRVALVSNVTGQPAGPGYGSTGYWVDHVRAPVRFFAGVAAAESLGGEVFVEVGPGAALTAALEQGLTGERAVSVAGLAADRPEPQAMLEAAARLFGAGVDVDWGATFAGTNPRRTDLPTYAFARQRFWLGGAAGVKGAELDGAPDVARQLRALSPDDQRRRLLEVVCEHAAAVLGHPGGDAIDPSRAFGDLGFDSLTGVELRHRLTGAVGLALPRTLIFDYPTPAALAEHLRGQLRHDDPADSEEDRIWSVLRKIPLRELRRTGLLDTLLALAGEPEKPTAEADVGDDPIDSLSTDALIAMALKDDDGDRR